VGVQSGTTSEKEAKILTEEDMVLGFVDYDMATEKLREGEVDALIMDYPVAVNKVKNELGLKLVGGPFTQEFYGIVVAKGKEELLQPINVLIEKLIKTGEIKKIENKWLN
jgi:polar amino acid transport system substrate-binding protein